MSTAAPSGEFRVSRWTIRLKLQLIISGIIFLALAGMIAIATYFFLQDTKVRVQDNNLSNTRVIAANVEATIISAAQNSRVVAGILEKYPDSRQLLESIMFDTNENLIYLGIYRPSGEGLAVSQRLISPDFLVEQQLLTSDITGLTPKYAEEFRGALNGSTVLVNASPGFQTPIVGMSFPYEDKGGGRTILVTYLKMDLFLDGFQSSGLTETFMVNQDGTIVTHPDNRVVLAGAQVSDLPIVTNMRTSQVPNGQIRYQGPDGEYYLGSYQKLPFAGLGVISTVSEDRAFESVYRIRFWNLMLLIAMVMLALVIVFFFARGMTRPILKLVTAARMIRDGNYDVDMQPESSDELGLLTDSFNSMSRGLKERENLKVSFGKFVNKELAEMSLSGELSLGGEKKEVAVFFSDIRGFTAISEKLRPEEVVEFLNGYFHRMVKCVNDTHGTVDKFIGDALMATWGALRPHGNETENALDAALEMRRQLIDFNKGRGSARKPTIHMGAGINTGPVIAGQIGSDEKMEYTVIGDTVNLASRVEALTKHFGVDLLVTEFALNKVKGIYKIVKMDDMRVKGKSKPVTVYAVLGRKDDPDCPADLNELRKMAGIQYDAKAAKKAGFKDQKFEAVK